MLIISQTLCSVYAQMCKKNLLLIFSQKFRQMQNTLRCLLENTTSAFRKHVVILTYYAYCTTIQYNTMQYLVTRHM